MFTPPGSPTRVLNLNGAPCTAHIPQPRVKHIRPLSASVQAPRVYEPKAAAKPVRPRSAAPPPPCSKEKHAPPKVYEPMSQAEALKPAQLNIATRTVTYELTGGPSASRDNRDLLVWLEAKQQSRAAVEDARWRALTAGQREGRPPRCYEAPSRPSIAPSRPSTATSRARGSSSQQEFVQQQLQHEPIHQAVGLNQPAVFSFAYLGVPQKRRPLWDAPVSRSAGGSFPTPSDGLLRAMGEGSFFSINKARPRLVPLAGHV